MAPNEAVEKLLEGLNKIFFRCHSTPHNVMIGSYRSRVRFRVGDHTASRERGFDDADPFLDWLAAEEEIDKMLKNHKEIKIS
ncbi:MAG: hypothetical protein WA435_05395 [Gallionellaceae bacterium]